MPKIVINDEVFTLSWTKKQDKQLLAIGKKYRMKKFVSWKRAEADGALKGLPKVTILKKFSHRLSTLLHKLADPEEFKRKKKISNEKFMRKNPNYKFYKSTTKKLNAWKEMKSELNSTIKWTPGHTKILLKLCEKHSYNGRIKWKKVIKDPKSQNLPYKDISKLRGIHYKIKMKKDPEKLKRHREYSKKWNKRNKKKHQQNCKATQTRQKNIKRITNTLLRSLMKTY